MVAMHSSTLLRRRRGGDAGSVSALKTVECKDSLSVPNGDPVLGTRLAKRSGLRKAKVGTLDRGQGRPEIGSLLCKGVGRVGWCLQEPKRTLQARGRNRRALWKV
jgi:hypothetical protein